MCTDPETLKLAKDTWPVARKKYQCCECGSDIDLGEKHRCTTGLSDSWFETYRTCIVCAKIKSIAEYELSYPIPFKCLYEIVGSEFEAEGCQ